MKILDSHEALSELCKATKKYGMFISIGNYNGEEFKFNLDETIKAAPYLNEKDHCQIMIDTYGFILFNNIDEMEETYEATKGDEGPTSTNPYSGPVSVYAITCGPDGQLLNENT